MKRRALAGIQQMLVATVCSLAGVLVVSPPAQAHIFHKFLSQIEASNEQFAVAADHGHIWVGLNHAGVQEFDAATGAFELQLEQPSEPFAGLPDGIAVGHGTGETQVYVSYGGGEVGVYNASGVLVGRWTGADTPAGSFGGFAGGVAVDNNTEPLSDPAAGDVYVTAGNQQVIDVFKPGTAGKEEYVEQIATGESGEPLQSPFHLAVDEANGQVLVGENKEEHSYVETFEPVAPAGYAFLRRITETPAGPFGHESLYLAIDPAAGQLFLAEEHGAAVDEFALTGESLGQIGARETPAGAFDPIGERTLAVDPSTSHIFVGDERLAGTLIDVFGEGVVVPDVSTGEPSEVAVAGGTVDLTVNGTVNPLSEGPASCLFAWGTSVSLGQEVACSGTPPQVPDGASPAAVSARLEHLQPDTDYFYTLQATNKNGPNRNEEAQPRHIHTLGPGLRAEWSTDVSTTSATFNATIDPNGSPVTDYFEYGPEPCATHACQAAPAPPGEPSGPVESDFAQHIGGLAPGTTYHYRVVALSTLEPQPGKREVQTFDGPDRSLTTQPASAAASGQPDGRQWEMVSPPDKHGAFIRPLNQGPDLIQASADGGAITYLTVSPTEIEGLPGYNVAAQAISRRSAKGWSTHDIGALRAAPSGVIGKYVESLFFSPDLSLSLLEQARPTAPVLSGEASERTPYVRSEAACEAGGADGECYLPIVTGKEPFADVPPGTQFGEEADGIERVFFRAATPDLQHVLVTSRVALTGTPIGEYALYEWSAARAPGDRLQLVSVLPASEGGGVVPGLPGVDFEATTLSDGRHVISDDGSRVFWTGPAGQHFVSEMAAGQAMPVRTVQTPSAEVASTDGSKLFGEGVMYDVETGASTTLTNNFVGLLGASSDLSSVYFMSNEVLAPGGTPGICNHEERLGTCNLYVYDDGVVQFIATLSGSTDTADWGWGNNKLHQLGQEPAEVSSNGRFVAFMSTRALTGYDSNGSAEVFVYDAVAKRLVCASCNGTGARPLGPAEVPGWTALGPFGEALYQSRYLSDNGRVFFESSDALAPQDVNGTTDVYEFEPTEVGDCSTASPTFDAVRDGCVALISSGTSPDPSTFMDASETGGDVFFETMGRLLPQDTDTAVDVYDAHECTSSSPCVSPPAAPVPTCTTADACRAAPSPQPSVFGPGPSATFSGAGNPPQPTAKPSQKPTGKLASALHACRKKYSRHKLRAACERQARRRYAGVRSSRARTKAQAR